MAASIYNEEIYLNNDPEALKEFQKEYQERQARILSEKEKFSNVIKNYDELITKVAAFIRSLGYKSAIDNSLLVSFLIRNAYLSHDLIFTDEPQDFNKEISSHLGTSIVAGNGCCRNYSRMHKDVFDKLGIPMRELYCYSGGNAAFGARNAQANHVVSLIEHDNQFYCLDLYNNNRLYRFKNSLILSELSIFSKTSLRYKPYYEIFTGESDIYKIIEQLDIFRRCAKQKSLSGFEYEDEIKYQMINRLHKLHYDCVFDDFHEKIQPLKKEIHDEMESHFGKL